MNKLTQQEFQDHIGAVARARKIFINLTEGNITNAFTLYQEVLAEQERELILSTLTSGNRPPALFDKFERPKCPDCRTDMRFRHVPINPEMVRVQLVCENPECDLVLNSTKSIEEWVEILRGKNEETK